MSQKVYRREHTAHVGGEPASSWKSGAANSTSPTSHRPFNLLPTSLFTCIELVSLQIHLRLENIEIRDTTYSNIRLIECFPYYMPTAI